MFLLEDYSYHTSLGTPGYSDIYIRAIRKGFFFALER